MDNGSKTIGDALRQIFSNFNRWPLGWSLIDAFARLEEREEEMRQVEEPRLCTVATLLIQTLALAPTYLLPYREVLAPEYPASALTAELGSSTWAEPTLTGGPIPAQAGVGAPAWD
jgi:hypothetical protein